MWDEKAFIQFNAANYSEEEMLERAISFYENMDKRRSLRHFSDKPIPKEVIEKIIMTASSAPSGAHKQPWTFCVVSDPAIKSAIRQAAEVEEYENYHGRMNEEWLNDLTPFATDWHKPFLEIAPYLIVIFKQSYGLNEERQQSKHYYVSESIGIAVGFLLAAIHQAGLVALTHTPSPMNFLQKILKRPENERPFLLIPIGYAAENAEVPNIQRKTTEEVLVWY